MRLSYFARSRKYQQGFTLVELMVSVALFSIVVTISMGTLISVIDANHKAQGLYSVMTNLSFAVDSMTRNIRTGYDYRCLPHLDLQDGGSIPTGKADCSTAGTALAFTREVDGDRVAYRFVQPPEGNGSIQQKVETGSWQRITADDVNITRLDFFVLDTNDLDEQARVTMVIEGNVVGQRGTGSEFALQTTVMQQIIDY